MTDIDEKAIKHAIHTKDATADQLKGMLDEVGEARREVLATLNSISNHDGRPGERRREVIENGSVEDLKTLNAECEIEQAKLERLERYQGQLKKLRIRQDAKEAAERLPEYQKNLAKAAKKVSKANKALTDAWQEADTALRTLQTAHSQAESIHANVEPASDTVTADIQAAWQCAHTQGMPSAFQSPLNRQRTAKLLGHGAKDASLTPNGHNTVIV